MRIAAGALFFFVMAVPVAVKASIGLTALVSIDSWSGVAIDGYDPVAYFTDGKPRPGSDLFEVEWNGAVWRFANEGNLAAFQAAPQVYAPRFGGFDPNSVTRGVLVKGDVAIFAFDRDKQLYLFKDHDSREVFLSDGDLIAEASASWDDLVVKVIP